MAWNQISLANLEEALKLYEDNKGWCESIAQAFCSQKPQFIRELERFKNSATRTFKSSEPLESNESIDLAKIVFKADTKALSPAARQVYEKLMTYCDKEQKDFLEAFDYLPSDDLVEAIVLINFGTNRTRLKGILQAQQAEKEKAARQAQDLAVVVGKGAAAIAQSSGEGPDYGLLTQAPVTGKAKHYDQQGTAANPWE